MGHQFSRTAEVYGSQDRSSGTWEQAEVRGNGDNILFPGSTPPFMIEASAPWSLARRRIRTVTFLTLTLCSS